MTSDVANGIELSPLTTGTLLIDRARRFPDRQALVGVSAGSGLERRLSYAQLLAEAQAVAGALSEVARPGEHVAIVARNVIEWPITQYGIALAGLVTVAVNPALPAADMAYVLGHSRSVAVLHTRDYGPYDIAARVADAVAQCTRVRAVIAFEDQDRWQGDPLKAPDLSEQAPSEPGMLQYTSGTTGKPKGVLLSHSAIVNNSRFLVETLRLPDAAVVASANPSFHTAGCVCATIGALWVGGSLVLMDRWDPPVVLDKIAAEGASYVVTVSTMLSDLVTEGLTREGSTPRIPIITSGAANVPGSLVDNARRLFGAGVHNAYGLTEMAPIATMVRPGADDHEVLFTQGTPLPLVECKIVSTADGRELPAGEAGEIHLRGAGRMIGYFDDPQANAESIDEEGWFRTGDLAVLDEGGRLMLTGRLKDLIIRGGENIAPVEIENALIELPFVARCSVIGIPDDRLGETVAAVVMLDREPTDELREALVQHAARRLAKYKVPAQWFTIDEFPTTPSMKIQRFKLQEMIAAGELTPW